MGLFIFNTFPNSYPFKLFRTIAELENELECERLRREKLEAQLDACRQEIEKSVKTLRDYETKVNIMERYIHTMKLDPHNKTENKKKKKVTKSAKKEAIEVYYQSPSNGQSKKSAKESNEDLYSSTNYRNLDKQFEVFNKIQTHVECINLKINFISAFKY